MKITAIEIKPGMIIEYKNDYWNVLKTQHVKPGKGGAFNQVELKSILKGTKLNERFRSSETVEKAELDEKQFNFLYADGCHIGQYDGSISEGRKKLKDKIIGVTCHNSKKLAQMAIKNKAEYVAFGSFYSSKLKPNAKKADLNVLRWAKKEIKKPIVVIGGITDKNYKKLINAGAKYIAISSFIWDNPALKPELAIKKFR